MTIFLELLGEKVFVYFFTLGNKLINYNENQNFLMLNILNGFIKSTGKVFFFIFIATVVKQTSYLLCLMICIKNESFLKQYCKDISKFLELLIINMHKTLPCIVYSNSELSFVV